MNENVASIINGFESLQSGPHYRGVVKVNIQRLEEAAIELADAALTAPDWQISGVLPSSHRAFVSHAFYTAAINFAFRHFGGARREEEKSRAKERIFSIWKAIQSLNFLFFYGIRTSIP